MLIRLLAARWLPLYTEHLQILLQQRLGLFDDQQRRFRLCQCALTRQPDTA